MDKNLEWFEKNCANYNEDIPCESDCNHADCPLVKMKTDNFKQRDHEKERIEKEKEIQKKQEWLSSLTKEEREKIMQSERDLESAYMFGHKYEDKDRKFKTSGIKSCITTDDTI